MTSPIYRLRRLLIFGLACAGITGIPGFAAAQAWPEPGFKLIVPLTPGSGADTAARALAQSLGKCWKQSVVVDNKPGAGGLIGTSAVVSSEPTGHTLLVQSAGYAANPAIHKKLPYDPLKSLVAVAYLGVRHT